MLFSSFAKLRVPPSGAKAEDVVPRTTTGRKDDTQAKLLQALRKAIDGNSHGSRGDLRQRSTELRQAFDEKYPNSKPSPQSKG
jgi:hypothetical protein